MKLIKKYTDFMDLIINFFRKFPILNKVPVNFYRFFVVGVSTFILDFIFLTILYHPLKMDGKIDLFQITENIEVSFAYANILSVIIGAIFGYYLNKYWSFEDKSGENVASQFSKYLGVAFFNFVLNNIFFGFLLYEMFLPWGWSELLSTSVAKFVSTSFQVVTSYVLYKFVIFKTDEEVISEATTAV